jgi:hypothetical protein
MRQSLRESGDTTVQSQGKARGDYLQRRGERDERDGMRMSMGYRTHEWGGSTHLFSGRHISSVHCDCDSPPPKGKAGREVGKGGGLRSQF